MIVLCKQIPIQPEDFVGSRMLKKYKAKQVRLVSQYTISMQYADYNIDKAS